MSNQNFRYSGVPSNFYLASRQESSSSSASSTAWNTNATAAGWLKISLFTFILLVQSMLFNHIGAYAGSASFSGAPSCSSSAQAWSRSNSLRPGHSMHSSSATLALLPVSSYSKASELTNIKV